jgi:UDP-glucose 4-epimerase/UDP-arabinose 4-epimerase
MSATDSAVLVTGGAGYIGSHTVKRLAERGFRPIVLDNFSSGHLEAARWAAAVVRGDVRDGALVQTTIEHHNVTSVIHFAGLIEVARSVARPDLFYDVNVNGTKVLLAAMQRADVRKLVFSSSAAVYGSAQRRGPLDLIDEDDPKSPASPYGDTKLVGELMIGAYCAAFGFSAVALRYFNAAGSDASGLIGEAHQPETHLIPLAIDAALGRRPPLTVFGADYPTADGSCVRDYVHVTDLADAHIAALELDAGEGEFAAFNVGTGEGRSVFEVLEAVGRCLGQGPPFEVGPRRSGDPPSLVANPAKARAQLGWTPRASSLENIVATAALWRKAPAYGLTPSQGPE